MGEGLKYTQPKRNAYKIKSNGEHGDLMIDLPLRLVATKNRKKVLDQQADFDTIDLLTKRFNSKKRYMYSPLSQMLFDQFSKIGSGVVYYNNVNDLLDRLELVGGSIIAGNNGVQSEFSQIAHTLNKLGAINNEQLSDLLKEYVI